jgi:hypothetical protein
MLFVHFYYLLINVQWWLNLISEMLHREAALQAVLNKLPEVFNFCRLAYVESSLLAFGDFQI